MSNILQVTTPVNDNINRNAINNTQPKNLTDSQQVQNPVDPTRVVRADGQQGAKTGDAMGEGAYTILDSGSNYGAFIQRLGESTELPKLLEQLFYQDDVTFLFADQENVAPLMEQMMSSIQADSPEELLTYMQGQGEMQAKFSGSFFENIRNILSQRPSEAFQETVSAFLKTYNDFSSGQHVLKQMKTLTDDIGRLMLRQFRGEYQGLLEQMDWEAPNGQTEANTALINQSLIPFMASYISRTHDYGPVRNAVMLFIFHAVKYENGSGNRLSQLFDKLARTRDFEQLYRNKEEAGKELSDALNVLEGHSQRGSLADSFSQLILKGANGQAGLENIQQFYNIMNSMLVNESVYLPLIHMLVPFRYQGQDVMSEIWTDPDAGKGEDEEGRKVKMFLKFDIRSLGKFDLVMTLQDRQVEMQLYTPPALREKMDSIEKDVAGILKKNGLKVGQMLVREKKTELKVMDVFPEIREKEKTINVRI